MLGTKAVRFEDLDVWDKAHRLVLNVLVNFYNISQGSLQELRYYVILSKDLEYVSDNKEILGVIEEIKRMLSGLIKSIA